MSLYSKMEIARQMDLGSGQVHLPAALYSLAAVLVVVKVNASP
jgi:hypothetical protein